LVTIKFKTLLFQNHSKSTKFLCTFWVDSLNPTFLSQIRQESSGTLGQNDGYREVIVNAHIGFKNTPGSPEIGTLAEMHGPTGQETAMTMKSVIKKWMIR